jgi:hypothetical protein
MNKILGAKRLLILIFTVIYGVVNMGLPAFSANKEFQVNTYTANDQDWPAVALDGKGSFVVAWESSGQDGSAYGVFAQRFKNNGKALGAEFQVNSYTNSNQGAPAVVMDTNGNFVIAWVSLGQDGAGFGVFARRYNQKGKELGPEFQVNTYKTSDQGAPSIAMDVKGNFVITWVSSGQDGSDCGIFAQRFSKKGKPLGLEFQVNTYHVDQQIWPAIAMDAKGNFVVTWMSYGQDGSGYGVFAQRFAKKGKMLGTEFQVNTFTNGNQESPAVAVDSAGNFTIVWESEDQDGSGYGVFAQRYDKKGRTLGSEFQVNTHAESHQGTPAAAVNGKGDFIITWDSGEQDGSDYGVFAQKYNNKGSAIKAEFQVNVHTKGSQGSPAINMNSKGNHVIAWQSDNQDGAGFGIFARVFKK